MIIKKWDDETIRKNADNINWEELQNHITPSMEIIKEFPDVWNWTELASKVKFSMNDIVYFKDKFDWTILSRSLEIPMNIMTQLKDVLSWRSVIINQYYTDDFIQEHWNMFKDNIHLISRNNKLSVNIFIKYKEMIEVCDPDVNYCFYDSRKYSDEDKIKLVEEGGFDVKKFDYRSVSISFLKKYWDKLIHDEDDLNSLLWHTIRRKDYDLLDEFWHHFKNCEYGLNDVNLKIEFIRKHHEDINFKNIVSSSRIPEDLLELHDGEFSYSKLYRRPYSEEFLEKHMYEMKKNTVLYYQKLTYSFIQKNFEYFKDHLEDILSENKHIAKEEKEKIKIFLVYKK